MTADHLKTISTALGLILTVGSLIWGASRVVGQLEALNATVSTLSAEVQTAREERQKAWALACQAAGISMERCF